MGIVAGACTAGRETRARSLAARAEQRAPEPRVATDTHALGPRAPRVAPSHAPMARTRAAMGTRAQGECAL